MKRKLKIGSALLTIILIATFFTFAFAQSSGDSIYSLVKLASDIAFKINARYVDKPDIQALIHSGIRGMIETLDPFSEFLERSDFEHLMETTSGKYSGLGMTIFLKDGWVTVVAPMEGTPAYRQGLRAGDRIVEIDGKSTEGMNTVEASKLMRGEAGTTVMLKVEREGMDEDLEYTIERAVITIKMVPYAGVIEKDGTKIGYIRLARFGEEADSELIEAIEKVKAEQIDGLVFDLRSNGGGLLNQAVKVANHFLPKGTEIVYTKGRNSDQNRNHFATQNPEVPDIPLVVLVNEMSASASEIVAGAIQDSDRGVIVGNTTFGKGLVQQVYQLSEGTALKLTTAKWYVPSGRCIQKDLHSIRDRADEEIAGVEVAPGDSGELEIFHTRGGRIVYGGGGISPDVAIEKEDFNQLKINLERLSTFFDFSIKYTTKYPDLPADFKVTDEIVEEFRNHLKEMDFTYKSKLETELEEMKEVAKEQGTLELYAEDFENIQAKITAEKEKEFDRNVDFIKRGIKRDILTRLYGESAVYENIVLETDPYVKKAIELLSRPDEYASILGG
ncbi:MAG: S41 family peptidase [Candidatus Zixiibacteriota bacterium]|nr:MAG: S41 family peptidase [candidate division Zixibacteria bacterium]